MPKNTDNAVLVTGGSGYIGRELVPSLSKSGRSVVSMYHLRLPDPISNVYPVCSDLSSVDLLAAPLRGVETVVYLAWEKNFIGSQDDIVFDPTCVSASKNILLLKNLIEAMEIAGTKRLIFLSAIGASRRAKTPFLKEKYLGEFAVLNSKIPEKIVIRSGLVYKPNVRSDHFIQSVINVMKFPGFYPVPKIDGTVSPILMDDLIEVVQNAITTPIPNHSALLEISGGEELKVEDIFKIISEKFTRGSRIQVRGALGNSLVPIFERRGEYYSPVGPKLRDIFALKTLKDRDTLTDNPLDTMIPHQFKGFREALSGK